MIDGAAKLEKMQWYREKMDFIETFADAILSNPDLSVERVLERIMELRDDIGQAYFSDPDMTRLVNRLVKE